MNESLKIKKEALGYLVQAEKAPSSENGTTLDFDATPSLDVKLPEPGNANVVERGLASSGSVVIIAVTSLLLWGVARFVQKRVLSFQSQFNLKEKNVLTRSPLLHSVNAVVMSFLGLNVFFGGLTGFLLTGGMGQNTDDYLANLTPFKLAKLSHQHTFGYGILFGILALSSVFFLRPDKKRVIFPILAGFAFTAIDVLSWWLGHYFSPGFHVLTLLSGVGFSLAFCSLYFPLIFINIRTLVKG